MNTSSPGRRSRLRPWLLAVLAGLVVFAGIVLLPVWRNLRVPEPPPARAVEVPPGTLPVLPDDDRHVLLLMIDGLPVEAFEAALDAGRMPRLQALLAARPTAATTAIASFPSSTSPSVPELLSGRYVDMEDLPEPTAVHAFDRRQRTVVRYVTEPDAWQWPVPTLFDAVRGRPAITVFEGRWDGPIAILTQYNIVGQAFLEALGAAALSGGDRGPVEAYLEIVRKGTAPVVSLVVLDEVDIAAHFHGPASPEVQHALERSDALIGAIVDTLAAATASPDSTGAAGATHALPSLLDRTALILFGDHGMSPSGRFVDLPEFFARRGQSAVDVSTISHVLFRERLGTLWTDWTDVILVAGGSNITQVYLRDPDHGWARRSAKDDGRLVPAASTARKRALARDLTELEGIDQVMWLEPDGAVHVTGPGAGEARILVRGTGTARRFAYLVAGDGQPDPFRYDGAATTRALVCAGPPTPDCFHPATAWLDASAATDYPGAVPLLPQAFRPAQFAGDLMVATRRGYSFIRGQNGDHGNLDRSAMLTPLVINGPGVTPCRERHQPRLVDIYPSAAVLLGARVDDPAFAALDGRVLDCVAAAPRNPRPGSESEPTSSP